MKKKITYILMALLLVMSMSVVAYAKVPDTDQVNAISVLPSLSFSGNTAYCEVNVKANSVSDSVDVTLKLWRGSTLLATWYNSGTYRVNMSETKTVTSGYTYKLTADVTINGVAQPTVSTSKYH